MEAAFFDLDKTVIAKPSMMAFGRPFYNEGLISRSTILRGLWAQLIYMHLGASEQKLARIRESVLTLTKGWDQARIREIVAETLAEVVEPITYAEALELIDEHKAAGRRVYIISASPSEIVQPLARFLGVDRAIASQARIDEDGRYTGEMDVYAYGPYKADLIREVAEQDGLDLTESYAYSDSYTDLPMLEVVGHPVVVNPDRVLLKVAREREWAVRQFVHPVRLRDRVPVPPARATAAVGVSAALAGGAVVLWRVRHRALAKRVVGRRVLADRVLANRVLANRVLADRVLADRVASWVAPAPPPPPPSRRDRLAAQLSQLAQLSWRGAYGRRRR